jgi:hypothetical protein
MDLFRHTVPEFSNKLFNILIYPYAIQRFSEANYFAASIKNLIVAEKHYKVIFRYDEKNY